MKGTILILTALLLAGCSPKKASDLEKTTYFVSIPPQAGILKALVGEDVEIRTLVGEGQSPHSYEPTARQLAALGKADALFTIGVPFETALLKKIKPLYPELQIIGTDAKIIKRGMVAGHEHCTDHSHDHGEPDPHVWLCPSNVMTIASAMYEALDPRIPSRYKTLMESLESLQKEIEVQLAPYKGERFYVFHPSFGYFADQYGLVQVSIELDGKSPSPRQLAELIEMAQTDGVKVIFVQKQFPMESARAVAEAIDGTVVQLDPLAEDVVGNLRQIADAIAESYK